MAAETLPTTKKVEITDKKEFATTILNADNKIFMIHVAALMELVIMLIHPFCQAQVVLLTSKKTAIPSEYSDIFNIFFSNSAAKLPEYT